jgi:hypothetical protein
LKYLFPKLTIIIIIINLLILLRLVLRCRQEARARFAQLRSDVGVKLELLDNKHVQDVAGQLQRLSAGLATFYEDVHRLSKENEGLFPVEVDLTDSAFMYEGSFETLPPDEDTEPEGTSTATLVSVPEANLVD